MRPPRPRTTFTTAFDDYPDYPRDNEGDIPEPFCKDVLTILPEWGMSSIIDMNGTSGRVEDLTGVENEPLDGEFDAWAEMEKFCEDTLTPNWRSDEDCQAFDELGRELAHKLYEHLRGTSTIRYCSSSGERLILEARLKRIFRSPSQAGPEG